MASAVLDTVSIDLECAGYIFKANGSSIRFGGYLSVYDNVRDNDESEDNITKLPNLTENEQLLCSDISKEQHFTEGPAHFNDASLIKFLEEKGIGRMWGVIMHIKSEYL
jgi:DNA topoisomerase-1